MQWASVISTRATSWQSNWGCVKDVSVCSCRSPSGAKLFLPHPPFLSASEQTGAETAFKEAMKNIYSATAMNYWINSSTSGCVTTVRGWRWLQRVTVASSPFGRSASPSCISCHWRARPRGGAAILSHHRRASLMNSLANESELIDYGESISQLAKGSSDRRFVNATLLKKVQKEQVFCNDLPTRKKHHAGVPPTLCRSDHSIYCETEPMHVVVFEAKLPGDYMALPSSMFRCMLAHMKGHRLCSSN